MKRLVLSILLAWVVASAQQPERIIELQGATRHVQGVLVTTESILVTSVERAAKKGWLMRFDLAGRKLGEIEIGQGEMYHPGGFDSDGESIWIPVAEYRPSSRTIVERRSLDTLALTSSFTVDDHIGALAVSSSRLFMANWDARKVYEFGHDGKLITARPNPTAYRVQDWKFRYGTLIGASPAGRRAGEDAVVWFDPETLLPLRIAPVGKTSRGISFVNEGADLRDGKLYLLPEDTPSRVFVFDALTFGVEP